MNKPDLRLDNLNNQEIAEVLKEGLIFSNKEMIKYGVDQALFLAGLRSYQIQKNHKCFNYEDFRIVTSVTLSDKQIRRYIKNLVELNVLKKYEDSIYTKEHIIKYSSDGVGNKTCNWCNCKSFVLQEHHYPIKSKDNGKETIEICPNCHYNFHANEIILEFI